MFITKNVYTSRKAKEKMRLHDEKMSGRVKRQSVNYDPSQ